MDPMISLGQKNTLAEYMILSGANNRPPMLDKDLYESWKSIMELYIQNREHGRMILESVENGPSLWPSVEENGVIRNKENMKECVRCMIHLISLLTSRGNHKMKMEQYQVNTKFLNSLPPEWSKFVTDVKLVKDLHTSNFDQLHAYLEQHELHANEVCIMLIRCLSYKAMDFHTVVALSSNATSSRGNTTSGLARVVKCYNCQGERLMARQCTQPKRPRNAAWYKEKAMLAEALRSGQLMDEEQTRISCSQEFQCSRLTTIIPHNASFQTEDLDTYDSDCDDLSTTQVVLMANISNYGSDIISEVLNSETYLNDMDNQSVHALQDFEQSPVMDLLE
ncbi:hypothetical protein Tco_1541786 [Tanacetum coccineum]